MNESDLTPEERRQERMTSDPGAVHYKSIAEWQAAERAFWLEHNAVLRAVGQVPEGEVREPEDEDSNVDDLDDYDDLFEGFP